MPPEAAEQAPFGRREDREEDEWSYAALNLDVVNLPSALGASGGGTRVGRTSG